MTTSANARSISEVAIREISRRHQEPDWLLERRLAALRAYEAMSMPDPLEEEWRRTDLSGFDLGAALARAGEPRFSREAGELPRGVVFGDLHEAARSHEELVQEHLHALALASEWKLSALQAASWERGALVYVPPGVDVEVPLRSVLEHSGAPAYPHLLIVADQNSSVTVVQESKGASEGSLSLVDGVVEIYCRQDSRVRFVDMQALDDRGVYNFTTIRAHLDRGAELSAALVGLGARFDRTRLEVTLLGEGARTELAGLSFGHGHQHFDYVTLQDHVAPRTASDLLFKAALDGNSSQVWQGTARIQKTASASEANQASRNLLLSEHARAAPIPVLEIEAYDVLRCSHGATAGPLDEDQLFYLESRGIGAPEAQQLLVEAFFQEVVDRLPGSIDRDALTETLRAKIGTRG